MNDYVGNKENKQWIWLALDVATQELVGVYVGDRSRQGAQGLWDALPAVYQQCAVSYPDFWSAYDEVFPVPSLIPISGQGMMRYSPANGITVLARRLVKPAI